MKLLIEGGSMEPYLICVDLDGTLLSDDKTISHYNKEVIQTLMNLGHHIAIVTGRAHYRSVKYYEELALKTLLVNRNACHIHAPYDEHFNEYIKFLDQDVMMHVLDEEIIPCYEKIYYEIKNDIYIIKGDSHFYSQYPLCKLYNVERPDESQEINLISLIVPNKNKSIIAKHLSKTDKISYEMFDMGENRTFINIYPINRSKADALKTLGDYYQIPQNRIIAFGDESNDIEMIQEAHIGVAMNNASTQVKEVANVILEHTNEQSGVGRYLNSFFNLNINYTK